jgi:Flp pilus assembly protein CpaB
MRNNTAVIVFALALMLAGFGGVLVVGQIVNPPTIPIAIAVVDIPAGATLTREMLAVDEVRMNPKVIGALVTEGELERFVGATVVEPVYAFQPLPKGALSAAGNPAAEKRLALALADSNLVALVVPVTAETAPEAIVAGDTVDLIFGVGANTAFGERLTTEATPDPLGGSGFPFSNVITPGPAARVESAGLTPTPTAEPLLVLPVAKTIVSNARVLAVIYAERNETVQDRNGMRTVRVPDKLIALVVAVPRAAQELVQFAIDNGTVRVSLLSAQAESGDIGAARPTLGMTWNDLVAIVRMQRDEVLALGLPTEVIGPGAYAIEATRAAEGQRTPIPEPLTPTATPLP